MINGGKWFITNIENSDALLLVARTEKPQQGKSKAGGISLFLIDLPQAEISYTPIPKHGFNYYKSNTVFIENLRVHESCLLGEEGRGFYSLLGTLNPERVLIAAGAVGTARLALAKAVEDQINNKQTTFIEVLLNQELGEPFRRDAMTTPVEVAGIDPGDMRPQQGVA